MGVARGAARVVSNSHIIAGLLHTSSTWSNINVTEVNAAAAAASTAVNGACLLTSLLLHPNKQVTKMQIVMDQCLLAIAVLL
jgi:fumarate hydratase class II